MIGSTDTSTRQNGKVSHDNQEVLILFHPLINPIHHRLPRHKHRHQSGNHLSDVRTIGAVIHDHMNRRYDNPDPGP